MTQRRKSSGREMRIMSMTRGGQRRFAGQEATVASHMSCELFTIVSVVDQGGNPKRDTMEGYIGL